MWRINKLSQVTNPGLHYLHEVGWVHRDFSPGNIIVVGGKAKISDLEFAKQRKAEELERLTRSEVLPQSGMGEVCTVGSFIFAELRELN